MFSSFTSYLFGKSSADVEQCSNQDVENDNELVTMEEEGGWLLVNNPGMHHCEEGNGVGLCSSTVESCSHSLPLQDVPHNIPSTNALNVFHKTSRKKSLPLSLPSSSVLLLPYAEDSWYITPPSCFTAGAPQNVHISPLENLLIEHPSMSVYGSFGPVHPKFALAMKKQKRCQKTESAQKDSQKPKKETPVSNENAAGGAVILKVPTPSCYLSSSKCHKLGLVQQFLNPTDIQKGRQSKSMHRKQLNRSNKVQEFESIGKRHRRKDHMKSPSGKSNNRKY